MFFFWKITFSLQKEEYFEPKNMKHRWPSYWPYSTCMYIYIYTHPRMSLCLTTVSAWHHVSWCLPRVSASHSPIISSQFCACNLPTTLHYVQWRYALQLTKHHHCHHHHHHHEHCLFVQADSLGLRHELRKWTVLVSCHARVLYEHWRSNFSSGIHAHNNSWRKSSQLLVPVHPYMHFTCIWCWPQLVASKRLTGQIKCAIKLGFASSQVCLNLRFLVGSWQVHAPYF